MWEQLKKLITHHRRFADADWALREESLQRIEKVAERFTPSDPCIQWRRLFSWESYHELYERDGGKSREAKHNTLKKQAIDEILQQGGLDAIMRFVEMVEQPDWVGNTLAEIQDSRFDNDLLPKFLAAENTTRRNFIAGYIWIRFKRLGWSWYDELDKAQWSKQQIVQFFHCLPITDEIWRRIELLSPEIQTAYWEKVSPTFFAEECDENYAVQKLLEVKRPFAAIKCLGWTQRSHREREINMSLVIKALREALNSSEPIDSLDTYKVLDLIQMLQNSTECGEEDLFQLEWSYLPVFQKHSEIAPKTLQNHLANDPEFFCELIQLMYRSRKEENTKETTKDQETMASIAARLVETGPICPGMQDDGTFDSKVFTQWLKTVKEKCEESGHLEMALYTTGKLLAYAPQDADGLWIDRTIADALNQLDNEPLRHGFEIGIYNSRGAYGYTAETAGNAEKALAQRYQQKADEVEMAGFARLATTVRKIADRYDDSAERWYQQ